MYLPNLRVNLVVEQSIIFALKALFIRLTDCFGIGSIFLDIKWDCIELVQQVS